MASYTEGVKELIDGVWTSEPGEASPLIMPDGCVDLVEREGRVWVVGPMRTARRVDMDPHASVRGLRFRPGCVRAWLDVSPKELLDQLVPLADFRLFADETSLDAILPELTSRARRGLKDDHVRIDWVLKQLDSDPTASHGHLAQACGWSSRHLRRRIHEEVGLSPKAYAGVRRTLRLSAAMGTERRSSLTELAHHHGFADQAHMCREVKRWSGLSPAKLRQEMSVSFNAPAAAPVIQDA